MTQVSDKAVWSYCKSSFEQCMHCEEHFACAASHRKEIIAALRAVAEHPVGLPEGWVAGPVSDPTNGLA